MILLHTLLKFLVLILITLTILFILLKLYILPKLNEKTRPEYFKKTPLTNREQKFYIKLLKTFPDKIILAQVDMKQILEIKGYDKWRLLHQKIAYKSIDFLICNKDFTIIAAIELDDSTHETTKQKKRDKDKDAALQSARIKLIRLRDIPNETDLQKLIYQPGKDFLT